LQKFAHLTFYDTNFEDLENFLAVQLPVVFDGSVVDGSAVDGSVVEERSCVSLFDVAKIKSVVPT